MPNRPINKSEKPIAHKRREIGLIMFGDLKKERLIPQLCKTIATQIIIIRYLLARKMVRLIGGSPSISIFRFLKRLPPPNKIIRNNTGNAVTTQA
jgi:hypothetical protein